jgi:polyhydroxyalkanoate synthase
MGQERFADVVERFTQGYAAPPPAPEVQTRWTDEIERARLRMTNFARLMLDPVEPRTGPTPRQEVYRKGKARLYRYGSASTHRTPLLFVPNLGISRPYIFDLLPGGSFIEYMTAQGFDFYLLDWGTFGPEDNELTVEDCVTRILPRMAAKALESSGAAGLSVLGYCMGAPLAASFLATYPEVPVKNFINMAGPIDFAKAGLFALWLDKRFFNVDRFVDVVGAIPADLVRAGFKLLKPTMDLSTSLNLWWNLWNDKYLEGFSALNKWANDYVAFPAEFFRHWVGDFYQQNQLVRGELRMGGRPVQLARITCPVFVVGAREDYIAPPECVKALLEHVGSRDKEYVELPGGHISLIAGRGAAAHCWPKVSDWLARRS